MWVLDHLEDIDSDMSAFHRVDDAVTALPAPLYFARAVRLGAYQGVMQARIFEARQREQGGTSLNIGGGRAGAPQGPATKISDEAMLEQLANEGWVERG